MRGRIRSIKPEVHLDEELWDIEQRTSLPVFRGFTGLWNQADREGRFEWRPRALKAAILPYWDGDFRDVLEALAEAGFVTRYEVDGKSYGHVRTFHKHQSINNKEEASRLPAPPETREPRVPDASTTREPPVPILLKGNGREGKGTEPLDASPTRREGVGREGLKFLLREHVATALSNAGLDPQGAGDGQWRDGCAKVEHALAKGAYPTAEAACVAFASRLATACQSGLALGHALRQTPLVGPFDPAAGARRGGFVPPAPAGSYGPPTNLDDVFGPEDPASVNGGAQ